MEEKKRKIPMLIKGIIVVFIVALIVLGVTIGLRFLERKQQKPRVMKALVTLFEDLNEDKFSVNKLYQLLESGKITYSGKVNIGTIDSSLLGNSYKSLEKLFKNATIDFTINRNNPEKKMNIKASYETYGVSLANIEGFIDEKEGFIKAPEIYDNYLKFQTENIRSQYEASLLYTILGEKLPLPKEEFSLHLFSEMEIVDVDAEKNDMLDFFKENIAGLTDLYKKIEVTKLSQKTDVLLEGKYQTCTAYEMQIPTEFLKMIFYKMLKEPDKQEIIWKDEELKLMVYLNPKNQALKIEGEGNFTIYQEDIFLSFVLYPKGVENQFDSMQLDFTIRQEKTGKEGSFILVSSNQFEEIIRNLHVQLKMLKPYTATFLDIDFSYNQENGESQVDFDLETPMLSADGKGQIQYLNTDILKPEEQESVEIFKLSLLELLQLITKLNLKIFGK